MRQFFFISFLVSFALTWEISTNFFFLLQSLISWCICLFVFDQIQHFILGSKNPHLFKLFLIVLKLGGLVYGSHVGLEDSFVWLSPVPRLWEVDLLDNFNWRKARHINKLKSFISKKNTKKRLFCPIKMAVIPSDMCDMCPMVQMAILSLKYRCVKNIE